MMGSHPGWLSAVRLPQQIKPMTYDARLAET